MNISAVTKITFLCARGDEKTLKDTATAVWLSSLFKLNHCGPTTSLKSLKTRNDTWYPSLKTI